VGLILDSSVLIAGERSGETVRQVVQRIQTAFGDVESAVSAITIVELNHGVYRAKTREQSGRRKAFVEELCRDLLVHPVTLEIALLAGRIEGEQPAKGNIIAFEDLVIGATALHLGFDVATLNLKHFQRIPGLNVVSV
jgi:predicted nucleic acid-binding protein